MKKPVTVVIADKDPSAIDGLKLLIETEEDLSVVGQALATQELVEQARKLKPDVVLMDFINSDGQGIETLRRLKHEFPGLKVIVMTTYPLAVREMLLAGASHIFLKDCAPEELFSAIRN